MWTLAREDLRGLMQSTVQHGRQPAPQPAAPPTDPRTDPRTRNQPPTPVTADLEGVCRDFIWGICSMGPQCKYRHELEFESMKAVLKFCHDHQNRSTGCSRSDCSYLHTSREEENLFLTTGQIPRLLVDRYTAMSQVETPVPSTSEPATNGPPQNMIYDYIVQPPPPPPPLPAPGSNPTHPPSMQPPMNTSMQGSTMTMQSPIQGPMLNPMQGPMPTSMQGPMPNSMQGPMLNPMQGPLPNQMMSSLTNTMQGAMPNPIQGLMPNSIQGSLQGPMPNSMQGSMQGPIQSSMQGPIPNSIHGSIQGSIPNSIQGSLQGPIPNSIQGSMQGPLPNSMAPVPAAMPPPPPPPPPPHTSSVSSFRMGSAYSVAMMQPQPNIPVAYHPISQPSSLPPLFDPSVPPPPLPQPSTSHGLKRPASEIKAGPSKLWKPDYCNDSSCELCVQRLIRVELNNRQIETVTLEVEQLRAEIAARLEDQDRKKMVLKTILSPDMYRLTQDYIENGSPMVRSETYSPPNLFSSSVASANNSIIHQLVDMILANNSRGSIDPIPPNSPEDDELFHLTTRSRSSSWSADALTNLLELIRGPLVSAESERPSATNGYGRYMDGGSPPRFYEASRSYPDVVKPGRGYEAGPSFEEPRYGPAAAPPRPYPSAGESASSVASSAAPPYLPASAGYSAPSQPQRAPAYSFTPNMVNPPAVPYSGVMVQPPRPPPPPQNAHNPYFVGTRYPNQTYYPPYQ